MRNLFITLVFVVTTAMATTGTSTPTDNNNTCSETCNVKPVVLTKNTQPFSKFSKFGK
jgi:hypothetical protein